MNLSGPHLLIPGERLGESSDQCHLAIVERAQGTNDNVYIVGTPFLENYYTMFDATTNDEFSLKVGFAERKKGGTFQNGRVTARFELDYKVVL